MEYECPKCKILFDLNFTDDPENVEPGVNYCPNCGCQTVHEA